MLGMQTQVRENTLQIDQKVTSISAVAWLVKIYI